MEKREEKRLTPEEIAYFELFNEKNKLGKAQVRCKQLEKELALQKIKTLDAESKLLDKDLLDLMEKQNVALRNHKEYVNKLKESLDVTTEQFGFNPETGEVL